MTVKKIISTARRQKRASSLSTRWHDAVILNYAQFMAWPNVERVGLGWKERGGMLTSRRCVKIYVNAKTKKVVKAERLPLTATVLLPIGKGLYEAKRVPTDVVWHKKIDFCKGTSDFLNPLLSGGLIGIQGSAGTCACVVRDVAGRLFALTAGHVVMPVPPSPGDVAAGMPVLQPPVPPANPQPGVSPLLGRTVGGHFGNRPDGFADFALIELRPGRTAVNQTVDGAPTNGPILPYQFVVNNRIQAAKYGAISGRTEASFGSAPVSIQVDGMTITNIFEFLGLPGKLFGTKGDSGALVVSVSPGSAGAIIGLLFATSPPAPDAPAGRGFVFPFERLSGLRPV